MTIESISLKNSKALEGELSSYLLQTGKPSLRCKNFFQLLGIQKAESLPIQLGQGVNQKILAKTLTSIKGRATENALELTESLFSATNFYNAITETIPATEITFN